MRIPFVKMAWKTASPQRHKHWQGCPLIACAQSQETPPYSHISFSRFCLTWRPLKKKEAEKEREEKKKKTEKQSRKIKAERIVAHRWSYR